MDSICSQMKGPERELQIQFQYLDTDSRQERNTCYPNKHCIIQNRLQQSFK